jgi:tetratricopeptide (TPR) repeat protein
VKSQAGHFQFIQEAYRSLQKKRYQEALVLLENVLSARPDDPYPYFLISVVYLFSDKFDRAHGIMDRLKRVNPDYLPLVQLQAFLYLKSATSYESAMARYMELVEKYPADHKLNRALQSVRKISDFAQLQKHARLQDFVDIPQPSKPRLIKTVKSGIHTRLPGRGERRFKIRLPLLAGISAIVIVAALLTFFALRDTSPWQAIVSAGKNLNTDTVDKIYLGEPGYSLLNPVSREKPLEFYYSNHDVVTDFEKAKRLIKDGRYNEALLILNRLNNSNARFTVKEKFEFLIKFIVDMEDRVFENIPYNTLRSKLHLYRGFALNWEGKITNLKNTRSSQSFTLLIDYKNNDIFSGIADVYSATPYPDLANGDLVTLRGVFVNTMGDDQRLYVVAHDVKKNNK